jgi:hypothetical protein
MGVDHPHLLPLIVVDPDDPTIAPVEGVIPVLDLLINLVVTLSVYL